MITTREDAMDALQGALADVDNPVGAARALGRVAGQFQPAVSTSWQAFQFAAEKLLEPWFGENTQAVVWTLLDWDFGCVARDDEEPPGDADERPLPLAVSALEAEPPDAPSFDADGFILNREIHLFAGESGVGKTSLAEVLAGSIAGGSDLFKCPAFKVNAPGPVLFISEEDGLGCLVNRLEAIVRGHGWDRERVLSNCYFLAQEGASLDDPAWRAHILAEVERLGVRLIVFDPYAELTSAAENSNDEAKPNVKFFRKINKAGASVLVNLHTGKWAENRTKQDKIRGAGAIGAAARVIFLLSSMEIGIAVECFKMSRSEKPRKFVVKREIESDPENRALWESARFTYASQVAAENDEAELFVLENLKRRGTLNTTQLKDLAKGGTGVNGEGVSGALRDLSAIGKIGYEKGPNNSKRWHILPVAQESRQPDLPGLPEVARQPKPAAPVVAFSRREATGAGDSGQAGNPDDDLPYDGEDYEQVEREAIQAESENPTVDVLAQQKGVT